MTDTNQLQLSLDQGSTGWSKDDNDGQDSSESDSTEAAPPDRTPVEPDIHNDNATTATETIDLGVIQANYTTRYINQTGAERAVIHLFCRSPKDQGELDKGEFIQVDVHGFKPYFYVPIDEAKSINVDENDEIASVEMRDENGDHYTTIRGTNVAKVKTHIPRTVGQMRDDYDHYEADVLFPDRFLIDNEITSGIRVPAELDNNTITLDDPSAIEPVDVNISPRVHMMDIEVEDRNGFPEPEAAEEPVICITAHDSYDDQYQVWYYNSESVSEPVPTALEDYEFITDNNSELIIKSFQTEEALLRDYIKYLNRSNPDVITGWNFDDFDATYICNRIDNIDADDLDKDDLSRVDEVWDSGWRGPNIKGRVVIDLLEAYKRTKFTELESYRLEDVGQRELGVGKEVFDGDVGSLWETDPLQLIEYNLRDVELCVELNRSQDILPFWDEVRQFVGCRLEDAPIPGDAVDMYVLHKVHERFVLPSKGTVESDDHYEGGSVFEPIEGVEEMVSVLDLKSLYPMCMYTINASPETKVTDEYAGETYEAPNGILYRKDEDGIIRDMVDELLTEREQKKELRNQHDPGDEKYELYDRQQGAVKVIMNSLYGTLGWDRFRLYDKDNAAAVTATGRGVIEFTEQVANELGYEVTYGDTDSVMLSIEGVDYENVTPDDKLQEAHPDASHEELQRIQAALDHSFDLEEQINNRYDEYAARELNAQEHRFEIEFEKFYRRFFQAGKKKRYAGHIMWKEGKYVDDIDITGFETERSDAAEITNKAQTKVLKQLVTGVDQSTIRNDIHELLTSIRNGEISVEEIGIPEGFGQPLDEYDTETAHVRGAKYANVLFGTQFKEGSKPRRVYLNRVRSSFFTRIEEEKGITPGSSPVYQDFKRNTDVICFIRDDQVPPEFEIDWEKMINKTIRSPLEPILTAVGIQWDEVTSGQEQTGLANFM